MTRQQSQRARRTAIRALIASPFVVTTLAFGAVTTPAESVPPLNTVSVIGRLPNMANAADAALDKTGSAGAALSDATYLLADPIHHVLIQANDTVWSYDHRCKGGEASQSNYVQEASEWMTYDMDTFAPLEVGCGLPSLSGQNELHKSSNTGEPVGVVDTTSGTVLVPCLYCGAILAVNDSDLKAGTTAVCAATAGGVPILGTAELPGGSIGGTLNSSSVCTLPDGWPANPLQQPYEYLHYLSWYAPTDDVVAVTDNFSIDQSVPTGQAGVAVTDYHVTIGTDGAIRLRLEWTQHIPGNVCGRSLNAAPLSQHTGAAYRSENLADPAIFVPCTTDTPKPGNTAPADATSIVKVPLTGSCPDGSRSGCPANDPPTNLSVAAAPFAGQSWLFDPRGERGFLLPTDSFNGFTVAVYDGARAGSLVARSRVGAPNIGFMSYGLDPATGRAYFTDPQKDGLALLDGRRTPVTPGYPFPAIRSPWGRGGGIATIIVPPDAANPYTRAFIPLYTDSVTTPQPRTYLRYFTVVADRVPVSQDPPPTQVDSNTYTGAVPHGATVSSTYRAHAAGYGLHSDLVGGYGGLVNNPSGGSFTLPFGDKSQNVALGAVGSSSFGDGAGDAISSAAFDVNGNGQQIGHSCSDVSSPQSCVPPQCPPPGFVGQLVNSDPCAQGFSQLQGALPSTSTAQDWPYPVAECSQPGPDRLRSQEVQGINQTAPHPANPTPDSPPVGPSKVVGSRAATGARALADCGNGQVKATGQFQCGAADAGSPPPSQPSMPSAASTPDPDSTLPASNCMGNTPFGTVTMTGARTDTVVAPPSNGQAQGQVTATAYGVRIALPDGTVLDIGQITQTAAALAGGRPGTATTVRTVLLSNVTISGPNLTHPIALAPSPSAPADPAGLLDILNSVDPTHLYVTFPTPDERFGVATDGVSPNGSPGGYLAAVQASPSQQQGDTDWNGMKGFGGSEKTFLPAMRLVLYNPGDAQVNREVLDFAGVEADAELGIQVASDSTNVGTVTTDSVQSMVQAGYPPVTGGTPGNPPVPRFPGQPIGKMYPPGLLGALERALDGLAWLVRSPLGGLQMAAFLCLLGVPFLLLRRRWTSRPTPQATS